MGINQTTEKRAWYSLPLHRNPKAIFPLYLAGFGSLCWQAVALFLGYSSDPFQEQFWLVLIPVGIVFMFLGFVGSFVYRHYRAALLALVVSLSSPPLWCFLFVEDAFRGATWLPLPLLVSEFSLTHPVVIWLYFQLPLAVLVLWRGSWKRRVKAGMTLLAAISLLCFFVVVTIQARREAAASPHLSDEYLSSIYAKNDTSAIKRLTHKRIVVTGALYGADDGLIGGGGPYRMNSDIEYDEIVGNDSLTDGDTASIIGTLEGKDNYGEIHLADSRVIN